MSHLYFKVQSFSPSLRDATRMASITNWYKFNIHWLNDDSNMFNGSIQQGITIMSNGLTTRQFFQWSKLLFSISLFGLCTAITLETSDTLAVPAPAPLAKLNNWRFNPQALQLEITLSAGKTPRYFYLPQPARIVVDLPDTKLGYVSTQKNYVGAIQRIRVSQLNSSVTRIVLDLAAGAVVDPNQIRLQPVSKNNPTRWVLRPIISSYNSSLQQGVQPSPTNLPQIPYNSSQPPSNLPLTTANPQQPFVTVPPLTPSNSPQLPNSVLPPATFPSQIGNFNSVPAITNPNFPTPTIPSYPPNITNPVVIEFGQPLPKQRN